MPPQPALGDRAGQSGAVLVRRGASFEERAINQLDIDATILNRLDTVGDLDQLAGGDVEGRRTGLARRTSWARFLSISKKDAAPSPRTTN